MFRVNMYCNAMYKLKTQNLGTCRHFSCTVVDHSLSKSRVCCLFTYKSIFVYCIYCFFLSRAAVLARSLCLSSFLLEVMSMSFKSQSHSACKRATGAECERGWRCVCAYVNKWVRAWLGQPKWVGEWEFEWEYVRDRVKGWVRLRLRVQVCMCACASKRLWLKVRISECECE